jgi:transcriptional regulator with XRE-family HTH domain
MNKQNSDHAGSGNKRTNEIDRYIGARLRQWRRIANVDTASLCRKLNITYQQLQKYEKGINRISASCLYRIAREMRVPVSYFYGDQQVIAEGGAAPAVDDGALNERLSTAEFMSTRTAVNFCNALTEIDSPLVKEALLNLANEIAERKRSGGSAGA